MRRTFLLFTVALAALGLATSASAAPLNWQGTTISILGDFPDVVLTGGGVATINGSGGIGHANTVRLGGSRGAVSGSELLFVTDPDTIGNSIAVIIFDNVGGGTGTWSNISGALANTAQAGGGLLPVPGVVHLCLVDTTCNQQIDLILTSGGTGVGVGGLVTVGGDSPIRISVQGAPWTIKTITVVDHITTTGKQNQTFITKKLFGFAHGANSNPSTSAQPSGVIQLVTPNQVFTNLPLGSNKKVAAGITLRVHFIPEPGLLALLGAGVLGLVVLGRRHLRK